QVTHGVVGVIITGVGAVFKTIGVVGTICHFQQAVTVIGIGQLVNLYGLPQFFLPKTFKVQDISVFVIGQILGILPGAEVVISYNYYSTATAIWLKSPQMTSILQAVKMVVIVSISSGFVVSFG